MTRPVFDIPAAKCYNEEYGRRVLHFTVHESIGRAIHNPAALARLTSEGAYHVEPLAR